MIKAKTVTIAKGKKQLDFTPVPENRDEILKAAMGPSGNLRAPTLKIGDHLLVGFNLELFQATFS
ncbi:MAG: hypothetical protein KAG92_09670 [Deltaproteobacteria bacterium]|nr:hypothetical protein [Deltaproteobacteria bacterium]